jgi:hypothetical protein
LIKEAARNASDNIGQNIKIDEQTNVFIRELTPFHKGEILDEQFISEGAFLMAKHPDTEQGKFTRKIEDVEKKFKKSDIKFKVNKPRIGFIRVPVTADMSSLIKHAKTKLDEVDAWVDGLILYQTCFTRAENVTNFSHYFQIVGSPRFNFADFPLKLQIPVGTFLSKSSRQLIIVGNKAYDEPNCYQYQKVDFYYKPREVEGVFHFDHISNPLPGVRTHGVFQNSVNEDLFFPPSEDLVIL